MAYRCVIFHDFISTTRDEVPMQAVLPHFALNSQAYYFIIAPRIFCDFDILYKNIALNFQKLWSIFDYESWRESNELSVFVRFISNGIDNESRTNGYLQVFLENEEKLRLDIETHDKKSPRSFIECVYTLCKKSNVFEEELLQNCILHFLSHGAVIYSNDLDVMYSLSSQKNNIFFDILLSMDLQDKAAPHQRFTLMYLKYTLVPDLKYFLRELVCLYLYTQSENTIKDYIPDIRDAIEEVVQLFTLTGIMKEEYQEIFKLDTIISSSLKSITCFPSLIQLSRDASRQYICGKYNIVHISQFYAVLKNLNIPNIIKQLLTYKKKMYY